MNCLCYVKGKITFIEKREIVLEVDGYAGIKLMVLDPTKYLLNENYTFYTYQYRTEFENVLVGLDDIRDLHVFSILVSAKGVGPKAALSLLKHLGSENTVHAIATGNTVYLASCPGIGKQMSEQLVLFLKSKFTKEETVDCKKYDNIIEALQNLGFKKTNIKKVLTRPNLPDLSNDELIKYVIREMKIYETNFGYKHKQ